MSYLTGKTVLVTGAGGSIGSELCREILTHDPKQLVMFDNSELALYNISRELNVPTALSVLGDVSHLTDVEDLFFEHPISIVFHTAAYKHVTLCEQNQRVAWRVNVRGTQVLTDSACIHNVPTFVLVSTDKAVNPTCHMGRTKNTAERLTRDRGFTVVRLGNVYGSSGSAVPLWKEQIARDEPVTITHPEATRYFLMPGHAARYIIEAGGLPTAGTYVPDMGNPQSIIQVARNLGARTFKTIGLRPGEKLHEELFVGERLKTVNPNIFQDSM